jgi:hypothetical protein
MVILGRKEQKAAIKKILDGACIPSQFITTETLKRAKIGVYSNLIKQMNAKMRLDLYRLNIPNLKNSMVVGVDVINDGSRRLVACSASYNPNFS